MHKGTMYIDVVEKDNSPAMASNVRAIMSEFFLRYLLAVINAQAMKTIVTPGSLNQFNDL